MHYKYSKYIDHSEIGPLVGTGYTSCNSVCLSSVVTVTGHRLLQNKTNMAPRYMK